MAEDKNEVAKFDPEAFGCALLAAVVAMLLGFIVLYMIEHENDEIGHLIGKVKSCETFEAEDFQVFNDPDGNKIMRRYPTRDRCRITFEDGRSKVLVGMPSEAIPTDRDIAVFWKRNEMILGWEDADEHKKRHETQHDRQESQDVGK